jgi:hypothetical protein
LALIFSKAIRDADLSRIRPLYPDLKIFTSYKGIFEGREVKFITFSLFGHRTQQCHAGHSAAASSGLLILLGLRILVTIGNKEEQLVASEGALACDTVSHIYSSRSMDYTSKLFQITLK